MSWWRVLYRDAGGTGCFEDIQASNAETAAWETAMALDSKVCVLVKVMAIENTGKQAASLTVRSAL